ncbi:MAG: cysteine-rich CWC family protein [Vibrio sp.]
MNIHSVKIDPALCPLCGKPNSCGSVAGGNTKTPCWCSDVSIKFPAELLAQVPIEKRRKACICKECVLAFGSQTQSASA